MKYLKFSGQRCRSYVNMWKRLLETDFYLVFQDVHSFEIFVTDFVSVWSSTIPKPAFKGIMKESNKHLEINSEELTLKGLEMLQRPEDLKESQGNEDVNGNLELSLMKSFGFPVRLKITLTKGTKELFFQKVTFPLLQSTRDLKQSQNELCQLLLKKDKEIQEYKEEGGKIALRHLKTPKFDEAKHLKLHRSYMENFAFEEIPDTLMEKIKIVTVVIKQEAEDIKPVINENTKKTQMTIKQEVEPVILKQELNSQPSQSSLVSPRKRPRKLMNL